MMSKINSLLLFICLSGLVSCTHSGELKDFTYRYTMESINNFKVEFRLNPDSTYQISRYNYFFDKFEGKAKPLIRKGELTRDEFNSFAKLIERSTLKKMDDSYGFDREGDVDNSIVYMVELKRNEESKFVSVNTNTDEPLPVGFKRLIAFTGEFISDKTEMSE